MVSSPFSEKNIQQCLCGTRSCRGVLGPKVAKEWMKTQAKKILNAGKALKRTFDKTFATEAPELGRQSLQKRRKIEPKSLSNKAGKQNISKKATKVSFVPHKSSKANSAAALDRVQSGRVEKSRPSGPSAAAAPKKDPVKRGWHGWALLEKGQKPRKTLEEEMREVIDQTNNGTGRSTRRANKPNAVPAKPKAPMKKSATKKDVQKGEPVKKSTSPKEKHMMTSEVDRAANPSSKPTVDSGKRQQSRLSFGSEGLGFQARSRTGSPTIPKNETVASDSVPKERAAETTPAESPAAGPTAAQSSAASPASADAKYVEGAHPIDSVTGPGFQDDALQKSIREASEAE